MKTWNEFKKTVQIDEGRGDEAMAVELMLFMQNNSQLHRRRIEPIQKNLVTKMARDQYDTKKAVKAWMYAVEDGIKMYNKEYGDMPWDRDTKMAVAELMANEFEDEAELGNYDHLLPKKYQVKEARSVPLVSRGQGTSRVDTHPSDSERLYQAKDKREYEQLMNAATHAMTKNMVDKFGIVGDYKKFTVNIKFKDAKSRKKFERMNKIEESVTEEARAFDNKNEAKKMAYKLAKKTGEGYTVLEVFHDAGGQGKLFQVVSDTASDEWNRKMNTRTVLRTAYNESVEEATNTRVVVDVNRAGYRKLEAMIASLDGYRESEFDAKQERATFHFDAKKHDRTERGKVAGFIKKTRGAEFHHSMTEELNERLAYHHEPNARIRKGIESGKFPMVASKKAILGGDTMFGVFQFTGKAAGGGPEPGERQGSGYVDGYVMAIVDKKKKILAYYGSHPSPEGAIDKFARNHKLLGEDVELEEQTKEFYDEVHAELKKVMDSKYYREFRASNGGRALENVINHMGKSRGWRVDKTVKSIIDKYGKNRDEYVKLSFQSAAKGRIGEEVELDESILWIDDMKKRRMKKYREMIAQQNELDVQKDTRWGDASGKTVNEAKDYTLAFDFTIEYTSKEGRDIQRHLAKKFKKTYSGSGSGGSGFDISFDGPKRELEKVKKYVEKEFGAIIDNEYTSFYQHDESVNEASNFEKMMKRWNASDDKKVMDILKSKMDPQHFGNLNTSNGGVGLLNIIAFSLKAAKGNVKKAAELTLAKYGKNHNEYKKLAMKLNNPTHQKGAIEEDAPTNNVSSGEIASAGPGDLPPGKNKKAKNHGCEVFTVDSETFQKCIARRKSKNERWNKFLNLESEIGQSIRKFSLRNPNKGIIIQDETTGQQVFVRRRWNDNRLKHNRRTKKS